MQITFLQDYEGIAAGRTFTLDPTNMGNVSWHNVTEDGTRQLLHFNATGLAEKGIVSIEEQSQPTI